MSLIMTAALLALLGQTAEMALYHDGFPTVATGSINVEVRSLDGIRKQMQELVRSDSAVSKSYSEYTNNRGKRSLNASYEVTKSSAIPFMDEIGRMGRVQNRNYSDTYNPGQNIAAYQRKLGAYRQHLKRLLAAPGADPDIVSLLDQQIQSLESQIESMKRSLASAGDRATISVQVSESGYNQPSSLP
ncbi:MAG TPA: hypothetical protein DDW31_07575, partial [candidate division Zixibacteria bacterium]|nr:hypothetical protein [candidate division Zixibacteria bacterium]